METNKSIEYRQIQCPANCQSEAAKKRHRDKIMAENPEQLYADFKAEGDQKIMCDLIFYTPDVGAWRKTLCQYYKPFLLGVLGRDAVLKSSMM